MLEHGSGISFFVNENFLHLLPNGIIAYAHPECKMHFHTTNIAALPSYITSYVVSVRQTRDLPIGYYSPHIRLPSDSTSRWTPLPSAISFPLPGGFETFTRWKRAPPGAQSNNPHPRWGFLIITALHTNFLKCLRQIFDQIFFILQPTGHPYKSGWDPCLCQLFIRHLTMRGCRRI